jgi:hypothetical protein
MEANTTFCWVCRLCGKDGPWQTDPLAAPKGWLSDDVRGVLCEYCKVKISDKG